MIKISKGDAPMLKGKNVILAVSGSIAAYKIANLASMLVKEQCKVTVLMTENSTNFINPITFETLTGNKCLVDTFDRNFSYSVEHVSLAKETDVVLVAPASANVIAKLAHGIADDMLTTTLLACECKKIVAPAMNTHMYHNPVVQDNLKLLEKYGMELVAPDYGYLACGDTGEGKLPKEEVLFSYIQREIGCEKDLAGKRVLVTAGPTREALDPVRFITNHSTGKMGYALAKAAMLRGAEVTLVTGPVALEKPPFVDTIEVVSAEEMYQAVMEQRKAQDIFLMAAAVADYMPERFATEKIKKKEEALSLPLCRTKDILATLGEKKRPDQFLCGFSMETENLLENSRGKLVKKKADMIAANCLRTAGAGFGGDTNVMTLITKEDFLELPLLTKEETAHAILDKILSEMKKI
jgi:phosphopantothenoylcysteine decarboxylase/phosphopantothenate--cysteine ligase